MLATDIGDAAAVIRAQLTDNGPAIAYRELVETRLLVLALLHDLGEDEGLRTSVFERYARVEAPLMVLRLRRCIRDRARTVGDRDTSRRLRQHVYLPGDRV